MKCISLQLTANYSFMTKINFLGTNFEVLLARTVSEYSYFTCTLDVIITLAVFSLVIPHSDIGQASSARVARVARPSLPVLVTQYIGEGSGVVHETNTMGIVLCCYFVLVSFIYEQMELLYRRH